jgi:hypothetical protein
MSANNDAVVIGQFFNYITSNALAICGVNIRQDRQLSVSVIDNGVVSLSGYYTTISVILVKKHFRVNLKIIHNFNVVFLTKEIEKKLFEMVSDIFSNGTTINGIYIFYVTDISIKKYYDHISMNIWGVMNKI